MQSPGESSNDRLETPPPPSGERGSGKESAHGHARPRARVNWSFPAKLGIPFVVIIAGTILVAFLLDRVVAGGEGTRTAGHTLAFVAGAVVLSALTLMLVVQRMLRRPVHELLEGIHRLSEGDRAFRFPGVRDDEFGELQRAFNRMTQRISSDAIELIEAKDYLEGVIENSTDIIITVNLEHQIESFNTGAEKLLGYKRAEVIGQRMRTLFVRPEDRDEALRRLETEESVRNFATQFKTKDGRARDVLLSLSRLRDREGNAIGTFGISKDITKEKELLRQLVESRDYLEGVIENSTDIIVSEDLDHRIQTFNSGAEKALGYRRAEVLGERVRVLFDRPEDRDEALRRLEAEGSVRNFETRFRTKDGRVHDVLLSLSHLRDREGNPIGTFGISKDVTKEKELLRQLVESRDYLRGVIENSADIIITVNLDHQIQTFNTGAEKLLGFRREEVIGQRMRTLFVRPEDRDEALRLLETQESIRNFETQFRTKSGEARDVLLSLSRLRDREGNAIGTFGISKDITHEKELLRQLIQSKKLAAIGQAITGINHATKNIVGALSGGAYLVRSAMEKSDPQRLADGWKMVEDGIERISDLSKSLLNYAKGWRYEVGECDLNEVVGGAAASLVEKARELGITIHSIPASGLGTIRCDSKLLRTTIMDLASNAIDACTEKEYAEGEVPEVRLQVFPPDAEGLIVVEVADNGCGMDELTRHRIFEPFFTTKEHGGTGVGLAMASHIIEEHGGRCDVESEVDEGSTFRIILPCTNPNRGKEPTNDQNGDAGR